MRAICEMWRDIQIVPKAVSIHRVEFVMSSYPIYHTLRLIGQFKRVVSNQKVQKSGHFIRMIFNWCGFDDMFKGTNARKHNCEVPTNEQITRGHRSWTSVCGDKIHAVLRRR